MKRWIGENKRGSLKEKVGDRMHNLIFKVGKYGFRVLFGYPLFALWVRKKTVNEIWDF